MCIFGFVWYLEQTLYVFVVLFGSYNKHCVYLWFCLVLRTNIVRICGFVCFIKHTMFTSLNRIYR
jgi:hypothetical protein